jgi:glycosyltransferase involved in cell wall biosynthesis
VRSAPRGAIFLNVSQFPIWRPGYLDWLERRPDVRAVFFLHDLLPLELPEFFRPFEVRRHEGRMEAMARHAAGIVVASESTRASLERYMRARGRPMPPVAVAPLPVSPQFSAKPANSRAPATGPPYFVCVGTIEPRKNHLFLLHVWRELRTRLGDRTPHLVLVGQRGWDNENVLDILVRCESLKGIVREETDVTTPALRKLIEECRGLLMPTFAEGFGLPVAEAVAAGIPVIASDIDVFRQAGQPGVSLVDPLDGLGWVNMILNFVNVTHRPCTNFNRQHDENTAYMLHFGHVHSLLRYVCTQTSCATGAL